MANKVLVLQDGKSVTVEGSANGQVLTWSQDNGAASFQANNTGTLGVANGGTGATSLTQYGVLVGAGTSAVQATAAGTANQYLKSGAGAANPAFATIQVGEVTGAAPLASPTFTGTPAAPTPLTADSSTTIATTAFVKAQGYLTSVPAQPYDLSGEFVGTPASAAVIMRFMAVRAFTLSSAVVARFACTSNTGATTATFTVNHVSGGVTTSKGTVTIAGNATSGTGTLTSTSVAAGDYITVVATTPANVIDAWWTLPGTV